MTSIHFIFGDIGSAGLVGVAAQTSRPDWLKAEFAKDTVILAGDVTLPASDLPDGRWRASLADGRGGRHNAR